MIKTDCAMRIMRIYIQGGVYIPKILDDKKIPKDFLSLAYMFFVYFCAINRWRFFITCNCSLVALLMLFRYY